MKAMSFADLFGMNLQLFGPKKLGGRAKLGRAKNLGDFEIGNSLLLQHQDASCLAWRRIHKACCH